MSLIGQVIHGNLRIRSLIGQGAMGEVYLAENVELPDRKVAVKVLLGEITSSPNFQERFGVEARNQAGLDHPNIVHVVDYFREAGRYFLVMEYVEGSSLRQLIQERGKLAEEQAVAILDGVLAGLDHAHQRGVIHRDVKPSNILVAADGKAKLTDFGIAIRAGDARLTATGSSTVGTPAYMSPEQIATPMSIDHRSDVYSAGIVLYEALTGTVPFEGESEFATLEQQIKRRPPNPRDRNPAISRRMERIVLAALVKNPAQRIQGCEQFRRLLSGAEAPPIRWKPILVPLAVAGALLAAVGLGRQHPEWFRAAPAPAQDVAAAAEAFATSAVQQFENLCRDRGALASKEEGKRLAEQVPDSAQAEAFERQAAELRANLAHYAEDYARAIASLQRLDRASVEQTLRRSTRGADRDAYAGLVLADVAQSPSAKAGDAAALGRRCPGASRP